MPNEKGYPTMDEALDQLGLELPRNRKLECPKHEDKTGSLHVYHDSFYCYSCAAHGDGLGLIALFTNQDVRQLVARIGGNRPFRQATKGMSKTDISRAVDRRRHDMLHRWFEHIALAYADSKEWAMLRAVELWGDVFDETYDRLKGVGLYDGEDAKSPFEAEQILDALQADLDKALPLEQEEGRRTKA